MGNVAYGRKVTETLFIRSVMVSQFLCQCRGAMEITLSDQLLCQFPSLSGVPDDKVESLKVIKPGKNADGYWTNKDLVLQVKWTQIFFEILHPGSVALFAFDNSQNHKVMAPDALLASRLNLSDGGVNVVRLRNGWFVKNDVVVEQEMQYECTNNQRVSVRKQKGVRRILIERGLWPPDGLILKDARSLLLTQPDFAS
jgi:hypothetical protein